MSIPPMSDTPSQKTISKASSLGMKGRVSVKSVRWEEMVSSWHRWLFAQHLK